MSDEKRPKESRLPLHIDTVLRRAASFCIRQFPLVAGAAASFALPFMPGVRGQPVLLFLLPVGMAVLVVQVTAQYAQCGRIDFTRAIQHALMRVPTVIVLAVAQLLSMFVATIFGSWIFMMLLPQVMITLPAPILTPEIMDWWLRIFLYGLAIAFITPGVALFVRWSVALPAHLALPVGPLASLDVSRNLTEGHRWRILALLIIILAVAGTPRVIAAGTTWLAPGSAEAVGWALLAFNCVLAAFVLVTVGMLFDELRRSQQGVDLNMIATVFD